MKNPTIEHVIFDFVGVLAYLPEFSLWQKGEGLNTSAINWIRQNRQKYTFSILSNNSTNLDSLLKEKFAIYDDFDHVFNSAEIGFAKPDSRAFEFVLNALEAKPEKCLFIDDLATNVAAAKSLGFQTIRFVSNEELFKELSTVLTE